MQVILLERVERLGQMGDVVDVKSGYARNYLLPQKKALRATKENLAYFENRRAHLEAVNLERKNEAEAVGNKLAGQIVTIIRQAGDTGQLYGSVNSRDIVEAFQAAGFSLERRQIILDRAIKSLGVFPLRISLHPEVVVSVQVNVARSEDEAERQLRGEKVGTASEAPAAGETPA